MALSNPPEKKNLARELRGEAGSPRQPPLMPPEAKPTMRIGKRRVYQVRTVESPHNVSSGDGPVIISGEEVMQQRLR